jgi:hypothetical protein
MHTHTSISLTHAPGPSRNLQRDSGHPATSGFPWDTGKVQRHQSTRSTPPHLSHTRSQRPSLPSPSGSPSSWTLPSPSPHLSTEIPYREPLALSATGTALLAVLWGTLITPYGESLRNICVLFFP